MPVGYKMTRPDGTAYYDSRTGYSLGATITVDGPKDGKPCGIGIHVGKEPHVPLRYNATYPWRLVEVEYDEADVLGQDAEKCRVRRVRVLRELRPFADLGLPNATRLERTVKRWMKVRLQRQTRERRAEIAILVRRYASELARADPQHRKIRVRRVKFYGVKEWASVRDSVRASVWDSVWDSVRDSVWDSVRASVRVSVRASVWDSVWASVWDSVRASVRASVRDVECRPFALELAICERGAVLCGIDDDGVAHVTMPTADEVAADTSSARR